MNEHTVTNFDTDTVETNMILEMGKEKMKEADNQEIVYFCKPDPFFFSYGIKWAFQNKNGLEFKNERKYKTNN